MKEQAKKIKEMINSYKLTYLIICAKDIGVWECLDRQSKTLLQIAEELEIETGRIEPILNALTSYKIISKDETGYYLEEYNEVLNKDSEYNQYNTMTYSYLQ